MKRTLWHILTAAAATLLPGMTGPSVVDVTPAPVPEAAKPAPEAIQVRRPEVQERHVDEHDDDPAPVFEIAAVEAATPSYPGDASLAIDAPESAPEIAPLARRSLGRPRTRAPDTRA